MNKTIPSVVLTLGSIALVTVVVANGQAVTGKVAIQDMTLVRESGSIAEISGTAPGIFGLGVFGGHHVGRHHIAREVKLVSDLPVPHVENQGQ